MTPKFFATLAAVSALFLATAPAQAQQHRATRLGHPSTRFAPPLNHPEELRKLLLDEKLKADVAEILRQAGWKGNVEDLRSAARTAEITPMELPRGTRMPFMSSRKDGKPVTLMDVLWEGNEPIQAYAFVFSSNGRKYHLITPRPCSNFYVKDLGPEAPKIALTKIAPPETSICGPFEIGFTVVNTGQVPVKQVRITDALPAGLKTAEGQTTLTLDAGDLPVRGQRDFLVKLVAEAPGEYTNKARAASADGAVAEASTVTRVRAPVLAIECQAPAEVFARRAAEICLMVRNTGDAAEPKATITLPLPEGTTAAKISDGGALVDSQIVWELPNLAAGASRKLCAEITAGQPGTLSFTALAAGTCAKPATVSCGTRIDGIPAILLEVIDLKDPIAVGNEVTYDIKVLNQGTAPATNVRMVGALPEAQEYVSAAGFNGVQAQGRVITMEPIPVLAPKAEASWRVVVKALAAGDIRFSVQLTSDQFQAPINEAESTRQYE